ncbi:MAG: GNAT family N-acetyltransferase [Planctomycetota bacterium]|nr:MAG: GNAT family N-acetyltransferase [Planctomycetota bacterium]
MACATGRSGSDREAHVPMRVKRWEGDRLEAAEGLAHLFDQAWQETGGRGPRPAGWPTLVPGDDVVALTAHEGATLAGYAWVRPAPGMNMIDFIYARPGARRGAVLQQLVRDGRAYAERCGVSPRLYLALNFWSRAPVPLDHLEPLRALGMRELEGVFLSRSLEPPPAPVSLPAGYRLRDWEDQDFEPACDLMERTPEPEPLYWDRGLCRRSILGAAGEGSPMFRDGFGQVVTCEGELAALCLATRSGYVNHVYTDPRHQGRGLARALLGSVLRALARAGHRRATILTHANNTRALTLYRRMGFTTLFTFPQFFCAW